MTKKLAFSDLSAKYYRTGSQRVGSVFLWYFFAIKWNIHLYSPMN